MGNIRIPQDYKKKTGKSVKDWSTVKRTTFHPGEIIPIYSRRVMAGSRVTIDPHSLVASNPLVSKLLGSFRLQIGVFFDSDSNYYGWLDNNRKNSTQDLLQKTRHRYDFLSRFSYPESGFEDDATVESYFSGQLNNIRGSVLDYMGIPSGIVTGENYDNQLSDSVLGRLDLGFILTYLNIFRNYYASKQEKTFPVISNLDVPKFSTVPDAEGDIPAMFSTFSMSALDDLFMALRNTSDGVDFSDVSGSSASDNDARFLILEQYLATCYRPHGGILLSTYLPDLYRNLLDDTYNTASSSVTVKDGKFSIDSLRFQNKLQRLIDRYDVSGGRFSDWLRTVWGVETRKDMDIPELIGVAQQIISPNSVTANSAGVDSDGKDINLGQFGGNFSDINSHRKHSFVASTPGRVMVCVSLIPMVDYSQGLNPELVKVNFADDYYPEFQQLGYQKFPYFAYSPAVGLKVLTERNGVGGKEVPVSISYLPNQTYDKSAGKQVAWLAEQTDVNRVHGEFADGGFYESWVLKRRYRTRRLDSYYTGASDGNDLYRTYIDEVAPITHYINPLDYQYPFIMQTINDPNWELQLRLDVRAVLPMGKRFMPNLE